VVGFGIAVAVVGFSMLIQPLSPWSSLRNILSAIFIILCPAVLLTFPLIDVEIGTGGIYVVWMAVALFNAAVYGVIGAAYMRFRKKPAGPATS
jgi:hypothetical protein